MNTKVEAKAQANRATNSKRTKARNVLSGEPMLGLPADERRAEGRALRDVAPRAAQGGWKARSDRRDPIELLQDPT